MIRKYQKNVVRWVGSTNDLAEDIRKGKEELAELQEMERKLDERIDKMSRIMKGEFPVFEKDEMGGGDVEEDEGGRKNNEERNSSNGRVEEGGGFFEPVGRKKEEGEGEGEEKEEEKAKSCFFITTLDVQRYCEYAQKELIFISVGKGAQVDVEGEASEGKVRRHKDYRAPARKEDKNQQSTHHHRKSFQ